MDGKLRLRVEYEQEGNDWVTAAIPPIPGAISQGRTREEARENALAALRLLLSPEDAGEGDEVDWVELLIVEPDAAVDSGPTVVEEQRRQRHPGLPPRDPAPDSGSGQEAAIVDRLYGSKAQRSGLVEATRVRPEREADRD